MGPVRTRCRHCAVRLATRTSGLCRRCYETPGVRGLYPSPHAGRYARRGELDFFGAAPLPLPTAALPGTAAKVLVLEARAARREQLFHPDDAARPLEERNLEVLAFILLADEEEEL